MSDLEKRYEVISEIDGGAIVVLYFSKKLELTQRNIAELVCKVLEANGKIDESGVDLTIMKTRINEYILQ